jgi:hypothetical protein
MAQSLKNMKMTSRKSMTTDEQEKAFQALQNPTTPVAVEPTPVVVAIPVVENEKDVVRISIDIPRPLYEKVKAESKLRGYSMRAFFVQRGWEYFEKE